jgi:hypothetical protein
MEEEATEKPVPYVPLDDDPVKDESASAQPWLQPGESPEQMAHDKNVVIAVSVIVGVAFVLTIITAQQMMENPDGCCARYVRSVRIIVCDFIYIVVVVVVCVFMGVIQ